MIKEIQLDLAISKPDFCAKMDLSKRGIDLDIGQRIYTNKDYNLLTNKPSINGVELVGDKSVSDLFILSEGTTAEWGTQLDYIPKAGQIIIYTDYATKEVDGETVNIPGIKIGDGMAYVLDLPFVGDDIRDLLMDHISNTIVHITQAERNAWNEKVRCYEIGENLVFTSEPSE